MAAMARYSDWTGTDQEHYDGVGQLFRQPAVVGRSTEVVMRRWMILALLAAPLTGCAADYGYGYGPHYGAPVAYDGYYDNYYGPITDGYWGGSGIFYYRGGQHGRYRADRGGHFRRDVGPGFSQMRGNGPGPRLTGPRRDGPGRPIGAGRRR